MLKATSELSDEIRSRLKAFFITLPVAADIDELQNLVQHAGLAAFLKDEKLQVFIGESASPDHMGLDGYFHLYLLICLEDRVMVHDSFSPVLEIIDADPLCLLLKAVENKLKVYGLNAVLQKKNISWDNFTAGFDADNWEQIDILSTLLPLSGAALGEMVGFITKLVEKNEQTGALWETGQHIYNWIVETHGVARDLDTELVSLAKDNSLNRFFGSIVTGLKFIEPKENTYYISKLDEAIEPDNAFNVLHALSNICRDNEADNDLYFELLLSKLKKGKLKLANFIHLCNRNNLFRKEFRDAIDEVVETTNDPDILRECLYLFGQDKTGELDVDWTEETCEVLLSRDIPEITQQVGHFLMVVMQRDLPKAYEWLEFRLSVMSGHNLPENAVIQLVRTDPALFRRKVISWLNADDVMLHVGVSYICNLYYLEKSVFDLPPEIFEGISDADKLFVAYKIVAYVYEHEKMQLLFLSVLKSINTDNKILRTDFHFMLSEYIVYNYRSTLELMRTMLKEQKLSPFSEGIMKQVIEEYEVYFTQLKSIGPVKELMPYKENVLLHNFYFRRQFADIPKRAEENSMARLFKGVQVNSHRWAIRRDDEYRHAASPLGTISVETEYPSGEKLNPVYQEFLRRTYKKIKKHEINID